MPDRKASGQSSFAAPDTVVARVLTAWVRQVSRFAPWVIIAVLALVIMALDYTLTHLRIDTDTEDMLSEELPFRATFEQYKQAFPQLEGTLLVVLDAKTPERARTAARYLAAALSQRPQLYPDVYLPEANEFLLKHALLYQEVEELEALGTRIARIQPVLGQLTRHPHLGGLAAMIETALQGAARGGSTGEATGIDKLLSALAASLGGMLAGDEGRMSWQALMSTADQSGTHRQFVVVQPHLDYQRLLPAQTAIDHLRQTAQTLGLDAGHGVKMRLTGEVALAHEELESVLAGAQRAGVLALVMIVVVLYVGLGSLTLVIAALITLVAGLIITAAFAAAAIGHLNLISVAFAVLYIGLGVDYAIHLGLRYREYLGQGLATRLALAGATGHVGAALIFCAVTTALGFYAFVPTDYAGMSELGLICGTSMFISLGLTLTLLPALLSRLPAPRAGRYRVRAEARVWTLVAMPLRWRRTVLGVAVVTGLIGVALVPQWRFDFNPLNLRDQSSESMVAIQELLAESDTPPWYITVLSDDPARTRSLSERLGALPEVDHVVTLGDFVPRHQAQKLTLLDDMALLLGPQLSVPGDVDVTTQTRRRAVARMQTALRDYLRAPGAADDSDARTLFEALQRFEQRLAEQSPSRQAESLSGLEQVWLGHLPTTLSWLGTALTADAVGMDTLPPWLVDRWRSDQGVARLAVYPREDISDNAALRRFVEAVHGVAPDATGEPVLVVKAGDAVIGAFQQALYMAAGLILLLLLVVQRSLKTALMVLVPIGLATVWTGAAMLATGVSFNFANVIALPLLFGLGVDNGIYMVHRATERHGRPQELLRTSTARGLVFSALTTLAGFGNLAFVPHPGTASMGLVLSFGIAFTLIASLIVLPALLGRDKAGSVSE